MPIIFIFNVINIHYLFNFANSDKICPCDLLLAQATETFSPKCDHSMEVNSLNSQMLFGSFPRSLPKETGVGHGTWARAEKRLRVQARKSIAKKNTIPSCSSSEKVILLNFKMIQFCCLSSKALKKSREVLHLTPSLWGNLWTGWEN